MQFNRNVGQRYSTKIHREAEGRTLDIEIKKQEVEASELNVHVKRFAEENGIGDLDSNSLQLITEEVLIMVLLPRLSEGDSLQYMISHNRRNGTIQMGFGYPGEVYNPFEEEDNIFMINIFREWITDIQFQNPDNEFNELVLTIQGKLLPQEEPMMDSLLDEGVQQAVVTQASTSISKGTFEFESYRPGDRSVEAGSVAQNLRQSEAKIMEVLIRDENFDSQKWYQHLDDYLSDLNLDKGRIVFDSKVNTAQSAIKSVSKVLLLDVIEHSRKHFSFVACKVSYVKGEGEFIFKLRYPGEEYNPFANGNDSRGVSIISRQTSVTPYYKYKIQDRMNELMIYFYLMK